MAQETNEINTTGNKNSQCRNAIRVSLNRSVSFYAKLARGLLGGKADIRRKDLKENTNKDNVDEVKEEKLHKEIYDELELMGLGTSAKTAIAVACILEKKKVANIIKIQTNYYSDTIKKKSIGKITIILKKNDTFNLSFGSNISSEEEDSAERRKKSGEIKKSYKTKNVESNLEEGDWVKLE